MEKGRNELFEVIRENERLNAAFKLMKIKRDRDLAMGGLGYLNMADIADILAVAAMEEPELDIITFTKEAEDEQELEQG